VLLLLVIVLFRIINNESVVTELFKAANYTYGPLLGLFMFGILTKRSTREKFVPVICILSPVICYLLNRYSKEWFGGYVFGNELLLLNGLLTFSGLWMISQMRKDQLSAV
jgi:solute:Na+ symporter, SSS family